MGPLNIDIGTLAVFIPSLHYITSRKHILNTVELSTVRSKPVDNVPLTTKRDIIRNVVKIYIQIISLPLVKKIRWSYAHIEV